jgi:hypothetical protein
VFTLAPGALRNKTYPLAVILDGITLYISATRWPRRLRN